MAPFALLAVVGGTTAATGVEATHLPSLAAAAVTAVAAGIAALRLPLGRRHETLGLVSPLLQLAAIGWLRDAAGGQLGGVAPLGLLPILWIAAYGSSRQLGAGVLGLLAIYGVPILVVGSPAYPPEGWREAIIATIVAGGIGSTVRILIDRLRSRSRQLAASGAALQWAYARIRPLVDVADVAVATFEPSGRITEWNPGAARLFGVSAEAAVGRDIFELVVPPEHRDDLRGRLGRLVARSGDVTRRFRTELVDVNGMRIPVTLELIVATVGRSRLVYGVASDRRAQEATERANREHLEDLSELLAVVRDLAVPEAGRTARDRLCATALRLSRAAMVLLYEPSAGGSSLVPTARTGGRWPGTAVSLREPSGPVLAYRSEQPLFVPDLAIDPRCSRRLVASTGMRAGYFLPILRGRPIGVFVVLWADPHPDLPARRQSLLGLFASLAAVLLERADLTHRLDQLARTDPLTGLPNRRELDETIERELAVARRRGEPLSLAVLDLDHFKAYNDRYGHQAGDELLRHAAEAWRSAIRATDTTARYGGEEFVVVMPGAGPEAARSVAERIRAATPDPVTVSIGLATWDGRETAADLVRRADVALFEAKRAGRNRIVTARSGGRGSSAKRGARTASTAASRRGAVEAASPADVPLAPSGRVPSP